MSTSKKITRSRVKTTDISPMRYEKMSGKRSKAVFDKEMKAIQTQINYLQTLQGTTVPKIQNVSLADKNLYKVLYNVYESSGKTGTTVIIDSLNYTQLASIQRLIVAGWVRLIGIENTVKFANKVYPVSGSLRVELLVPIKVSGESKRTIYKLPGKLEKMPKKSAEKIPEAKIEQIVEQKVAEHEVKEAIKEIAEQPKPVEPVATPTPSVNITIETPKPVETPKPLNP